MKQTLARYLSPPHSHPDEVAAGWNARLHQALTLFLLAGLGPFALVEIGLRGPLDVRALVTTGAWLVSLACFIATRRGGRWEVHSAVIFASILPVIVVIDLYNGTNDVSISVGLIVWVVSVIFVHGHRMAWSALPVAVTAKTLGSFAEFTTSFGADDLAAVAGTGAAMVVLTGTVWAAELARSEAQAAAQRRAMIAEESAEEARSLANAKSQFSAVMSHEIRTPVNGVVNLTRLLQDSGLTEQQHTLVNTLQASTDGLVRVLNDVLDFGKIEAGQLHYEQEPFHLPELIKSVMQFFDAGAAEGGIGLDCELDPALPTWVRSDPTRLRQVLNNLLSNAIKFTLEGRVKVSASVMDDSRIRLTVEDSGVGIKASAAATLFDPFAQADTTTTRRFGGTGLGLAICRSLCEGLGGEIDFSSVPGEGSTFWVTLPLTPCEQPAQPAERGQQVLFPTAKVLVAEDNPVNQMVVVGLLRRFSVEPVVVADGAEAVAYVEEHPVDLVFMDLHMPVMDGLQATEQIRALAMTFPVVAVTASALESDRLRCLRAGMNGHISKPLHPDDLEAALRKWLKEHIEQPASQARLAS